MTSEPLIEKLLSIGMVIITLALMWRSAAGPAGVPHVPLVPLRPDAPMFAENDGVETRVEAIAGAVALAEGYFAPGEHDGHSLPFAINNPGALKKPALGATSLATWKDTGLVCFPTKAMGWNALRHQVRLMLTGMSRIYTPSDPLSAVGLKYAGGDENWSRNVAAALGVAPTTTLTDVAPDEK